MPVTGDKVALDSFVPTGIDLDGKVEIQTLDAAGRTDMANSYVWMDWGYEGAIGWSQDMTVVTGVEFTKGTGFWVNGKYDNKQQHLQGSGAVGTEDVVFLLRNGGSCTGNPFPVKVALQDILPEGDDLDGKVEIQTLDSFGRTDMANSYVWMDWGYEGAIGWSQDMVIVENVDIAPGQGFWANGKYDFDPNVPGSFKQCLRFPAPEL